VAALICRLLGSVLGAVAALSAPLSDHLVGFDSGCVRWSCSELEYVIMLLLLDWIEID
jgi:hypothetical protein